MYPVNLAAATMESVETLFARFLDLQSVWAKRLAELIAAEQDDDDAEDEDNDAVNDPNLMIKA